MEVKTNSFTVWDYLVFAGTIAISMGIGIYFAIKGRKRKTEGEYLVASRSMSTIPVSISIMVSYLSAITILGNPAEMYTQGTQFSITVFCFPIACILAAVLFVPLIYPLQLTSVFEYLERRFNSRAVRLVGTWMMILTQVIYMGTTSFAPSTALEAVTGFPVWATLLLTTVAATFYTCVGGMKAVVWTDVFQSIIMVAGVLALIIQGSIKVGGMTRVWEINEEWGRLNFFNFDPDPTIRHTFWPLVVGGALIWMGSYGFAQPSVQRYSSLPTLWSAQKATLMLMCGSGSIIALCSLSGIVIFAYYAQKNCDPLGKGLVENPNQLVPFFVMETLAYPCIPGLFISALFSGALSSFSSSLNAMAAITWEDMLKPTLSGKLTPSKRLLIIQGLVLIYGCIALGVSFIVQNLEGTVLSITISLLGASGGPLTGMFLLGCFFPWANAIGAIVGSLISLAICLWIAVGAFINGVPLVHFDYPNGSCSSYYLNASTFTTATSPITTTESIILSTTQSSNHELVGLKRLYSLSYLWFGPLGMIMTIVVGLIVSFCTGPNSMHDVPTKYQVPIFSRVCCCLPASWQKALGCYRNFDDPEVILANETGMDMEIDIPDMKNGKLNYDNNGITPDDKLVYDNNGFTPDGKFQDKEPIVTNNVGEEANTKM